MHQLSHRRLHPKLADLYREEIENLLAELYHDSLRAEAATALRSGIEAIRLVPENGQPGARRRQQEAPHDVSWRAAINAGCGDLQPPTV